jgi:hypothetical protein
MSKKTQIFFIHSGTTFRNRKDYLHFLNKLPSPSGLGSLFLQTPRPLNFAIF